MKLIFELIEPKQNLYMAKGKNEGFAVSKKEISAEVNIRNNKRKQNTHIMRGFRVWVKNQPTTTKHTAHNTKKSRIRRHTMMKWQKICGAARNTPHTHTIESSLLFDRHYIQWLSVYMWIIFTLPPTHIFIWFGSCSVLSSHRNVICQIGELKSKSQSQSFEKPQKHTK